MKTSNLMNGAVAAAIAVSSISAPAMADVVQSDQARAFSMDAHGNLLVGGIPSDELLRATFGTTSKAELQAAAVPNGCCGNGTCCNGNPV